MADVAAAAPVETPAAPEAPAPEAAPTLRDVVREAATPAAPERRYKVKIDGEELEVDEAELTRGYQRGAAARKRFEAANARAQEVEKRLAAIKEDPWAAMETAGLNADEVAQARVLRAIERERQQAERAQLPEPVRRALEEAETAKAELAKLKAEQETRSKGQLDSAAKNYVERFNQVMPQAMDAAGLPKTPEAARMVVEMMQTQIRARMPVDPAEAARMVADSLYERNFAMLRTLSPERIVRALGKDALDNLQRHLIAQARAPNGQFRPVAPGDRPAPAPKAKPEILDSRAWDKKYGG